MSDDGAKPVNFNRTQLVRIRKVVELLVFGTAGYFLFQYGPFWSLPLVAHSSMCFIITVGLFVIYQIVMHTAKEQYLRWGRGSSFNATTASSKTVYQVPRRFGMLTIVFATMGIALLAAVFQALHIPKEVSMMLLGFVAIVAIMQAIMDRVPRSASVIGGVVYLTSITLWMVITNPIGADQVVVSLLAAMICGALYGYIAGAFIAGLFMGADAVNKWWSEIGDQQRPLTTRQSPWDEEAPDSKTHERTT